MYFFTRWPKNISMAGRFRRQAFYIYNVPCAREGSPVEENQSYCSSGFWNYAKLEYFAQKDSRFKMLKMFKFHLWPLVNKVFWGHPNELSPSVTGEFNSRFLSLPALYWRMVFLWLPCQLSSIWLIDSELVKKPI